jgi:hypothetical protein
MKTKILLLLVCVFFSVNCFAECLGNSCTGVKITRMVVTANGNTSVSTSGTESLLSCNAGTGNYLKLNIEQKNADAVYALLLTAHTTEQPLWLRMDSAGECNIIYVVSDK